MTGLAVAADGSVTFDAYVDAGPDTGAAYIIGARLLDGSGETLAQWNGEMLAALPDTAIRNAYPYAWASQFRTESIGFSGQTGARAAITLPAPATPKPTDSASRVLLLEAIDGTIWRGVAGH
ncbi:MAG: TQO small subunit DoxA domain-containing protein [Hyphomicrobium sp.]